MAGKEQNKKSMFMSCKAASLVLIFFTVLWFIFSQSRNLKLRRESEVQVNNWTTREVERGWNKSCNYSRGSWVRVGKKNARAKRYDEKCKDIFKGWNCISNGKWNAKEMLEWHWQPWGCDLPRLDPEGFLHLFRNSSIGFVGDSLNRNMFVSLVCMLKEVSNDVRKWRPMRADRGYTFLQYNVTLAYHRTNLLARYNRWSANTEGGALEQLGYKEGFRVDVDIPDGTWAEAPSYHDVLIMNTGHWWWAPTKFDPVKSPMLFFEKGQPIIPPKSPEDGLDLVLRNMIDFVDKRMQNNALKIFRTQSPRHFEGGDWNEGGTCRRSEPLLLEEVDRMFAFDSPNIEVRIANTHLQKALQDSNFRLLNITYMSEFRADAHPSTSGGKKHEDCMHWCLPGVTDYWNDLLMVTLLNEKMRT